MADESITIRGIREGILLTIKADSEIPSALEFPDLATAVRAILSGSARAIAHAGEERVRLIVEEGLRPFILADGMVHLDNRFRLALTTRR